MISAWVMVAGSWVSDGSIIRAPYPDISRMIKREIRRAGDPQSGNSSVTDALRKAKLACKKLDLREFGNWVDLELTGYMNKSSDEVPEYRKLHGIPEAFSPYQGWCGYILRLRNKKNHRRLRLLA